MHSVSNEKGAVLVFITLMIVLLMVMVGMGMDTGQLTYTRSQGQAAVDAAALAAVSGLPMGDAEVTARASGFNSKNDYLASGKNPISGSNITYIQYDPASGTITDLPNISGANGVRVALEKTNPYTSVAAGTAMTSPTFLTPLFRLFGQSAPSTVDVSVSAAASLQAIPGIPIAVMLKTCGDPTIAQELTRSPATTDNSCWTTYKDDPVNAPKVKACLQSAGESCSESCGYGVQKYEPIFLNNGVINSTYDDAHAVLKKDSEWIVPMVKDSTKCNKSDPVEGWASIKIVEVTKGGAASDKYIKAYVTCGVDLWRIDKNRCFSSRLLREPKSGTCPGCSM
jgi:Flp pilus assembly protein TadG